MGHKESGSLDGLVAPRCMEREVPKSLSQERDVVVPRVWEGREWNDAER